MNSVFVIEWFAWNKHRHEYFKTAEAAFTRFIILRDDYLTPSLTQHTLQDVCPTCNVTKGLQDVCPTCNVTQGSNTMQQTDQVKTYLLDEDTLAKLQALHSALHGGTDRERDFGHKLWLLCNEIKQNEVTN